MRPSRILVIASSSISWLERRPTDAKFQSSGRDLPSMAPEGVLNHLSLHTFPRLFQRVGWLALQKQPSNPELHDHRALAHSQMGGKEVAGRKWKAGSSSA